MRLRRPVEPTTVGIAKGVIPFRGECARGSATRGITSVTSADAGEMVSRPELAPSAGVSEASCRAELTTECGSTPTARSNGDEKRYLLNVKRIGWGACKRFHAINK
jgi:hypothetical protein